MGNALSAGLFHNMHYSQKLSTRKVAFYCALQNCFMKLRCKEGCPPPHAPICAYLRLGEVNLREVFREPRIFPQRGRVALKIAGIVFSAKNDSREKIQYSICASSGRDKTPELSPRIVNRSSCQVECGTMYTRLFCQLPESCSVKYRS